MRELVALTDGGVGVVEDGTLVDVVREARGVGDIRLGVVVNVERGVSAAFLDVGTGDNGFLHLSDWPAARRGDSIDDHLALGTRAIVQVTRARIGEKAPALTGNVTLAGHGVVLLPCRESGGVSRRLDVTDRERLRALEARAGCGVILRTASRTAADEDLEAELDRLAEEWRRIVAQAGARPGPGLLRREDPAAVRAARDYGGEVTPPRPEIDAQHEEIGARGVPLPGGGSVIFEQTEALLAIDVNTGTASEAGEFEATARRTNLEAAAVIARQLRLRDAGGVVVVDFIDMRSEQDRAELEEAFREALAADRSRVDIGGLGRFSLFTLTRRRRG
jgi:ribonuclease E